MFMRKILPYITALTAVFFIAAFFVAPRFRSADPVIDVDALVAKMRHEIKEEVRAEMLAQLEVLVAKEVRKEVELYFAKMQRPAADSIAASKDPLPVEPGPINAESIQEAVRRTIRDVTQEYNVRLTDDEMDRFVAGNGVETSVQLPGGMMKSPQDDVTLLASATAAEQKPKAPTDDVPPEEEAAGAQERVDSIERTLVQKGSILLPKGKLQFEPSLTYAHFSSNRININGFTILPILVVGDINTEKVKRDIFIHTWAFKYGLLNNLQTEVRVPVRFEYDRITNTDSTTYDQTDSKGGLGDVQFSMSRQIGWEHGLMPDLVASMSVKSNTGDEPYNTDIALGTGHWAVSGALVAAKASDPAVVFGSINYTYNIPRGDIENFGKVDPGDSIGYSLGTAIALSYQTAINFSFDHTVTNKMYRNGQDIPGSFQNAANFKTGFNWALSERSSMDFALSLGLTTDAPDFTVELRFPYSF